MEAVSLLISIISLLDVSLTACRLVSASKTADTDIESLAVELLWQQGLLTSWARKWGIEASSENGGEKAVARSPAVEVLREKLGEVSADLGLVERTLRVIRDLLLEGEELSARYVKEEEEGYSTAGSANLKLQGKKFFTVRLKMKGTWNRSRWVGTGQIRLNQVVASLKSHNEILSKIVPRGDISTTKSDNAATLCEAMAKLSELGLSFPKPPRLAHQPLSEALEMICRINKIEETYSVDISRDLGIREWKDALTSFNEHLPGRQIVHFIKGHNKFRVCYEAVLEWKVYGPKDSSHTMALERTDRAARLLAMDSLPEDLRVLKCVGFFDDVKNLRCGLLYQLPAQLSDQASEVRITTLRDLLDSMSIGPSLSDRFGLACTLARAVLKLHTFRWVHKDIRSANITFLHLSTFPPSLLSPYLTSFGLARPDHSFLQSESNWSTDQRRHFDALPYAHPDYHTEAADVPSSEKRRYHPAYDVYSLGCVLLEIGLWKPLDVLNWKKQKDPEARTEWRGKLRALAEGHLGFMCGGSYRDVVVRCLEAEGGSGGEVEESGKVREFCYGIVGVLDGLRC